MSQLNSPSLALNYSRNDLINFRIMSILIFAFIFPSLHIQISHAHTPIIRWKRTMKTYDENIDETIKLGFKSSELEVTFASLNGSS